MPWNTPTLEDTRNVNRSNVQAQLRSGPMIPNSILRVMADSNAGLAYLSLLYIDWLAKQLLPDTAEKDWLDRHANIWLTQGRKTATYASATITFTSIGSVDMPAGTIITGAVDTATGVNIDFSTQLDTLIGVAPTSVPILAITPGITGLVIGSTLSLKTAIAGINGTGTISVITDGIEQEIDDSLRARVLSRIRQPPAGGDASDWVQWATATPTVSVTRAWCSPNEMGPGTVTLRFMTDDLVNNIPGFPSQQNIGLVQSYIDTLRPVAVKDRFILAPVPEPINFSISNLKPDTIANRNAIVSAVSTMLFQRAAPAYSINGVPQQAQTIYSSWVSGAISSISTITSFTLNMADHPMPFPGSLAVLGTVVFG